MTLAKTCHTNNIMMQDFKKATYGPIRPTTTKAF